MKLLQAPKIFGGRLKHERKPNRLKIRLKWFIIVNVVVFLLLPKAFYGFYGTVGSVGASIVESRIDYTVARKYGRTVADARKCGRVWGEAFKGMNPMEWLR